MRILRSAPGLGAALLAFAFAAPVPAFAQTASPAAKPASKTADLFPDKIVAKGKGVEVKRSQLDEAVITVKANIAAQGRSLSPEETLGVERQVLDRMVQIQILKGKATAEDKAKGQELSQKRFDEAKKRAGSDESFARQLKAVGLTPDVLKSRMDEEAVAEAVLERELKISVADADVKKFYDDNPGKFEQPERVRASHVLLGTRDPATNTELGEDAKKDKRKKAEEVLKKAKAGEDFAKLAKDYSDDPGSKDKGGEYTFGRNQMVPEFEAAAFALGTNQVSEIVTTQFGYHIIKLSEKFTAKKVELATVSDDIKQFLKAQQMQKLVPDYMEKARKEAAVEVLDANLKPPAAPSPAPAK
jgi:peptidyl-prolyl cis-trans isomerase C